MDKLTVGMKRKQGNYIEFDGVRGTELIVGKDGGKDECRTVRREGYCGLERRLRGGELNMEIRKSKQQEEVAS